MMYGIGDKLLCIKSFYVDLGALAFIENREYEIFEFNPLVDIFKYRLKSEASDSHGMSVSLLDEYFKKVGEESFEQFEDWEDIDESNIHNHKHSIGDIVIVEPEHDPYMDNGVLEYFKKYNIGELIDISKDEELGDVYTIEFNDYDKDVYRDFNEFVVVLSEGEISNGIDVDNDSDVIKFFDKYPDHVNGLWNIMDNDQRVKYAYLFAAADHRLIENFYNNFNLKRISHPLGRWRWAIR